MFSRPDLHPAPFESSDVRYWLSEEGLPVMKGVVGALSCKLVRKGIPLHDLDYLGTGNGFGSRTSERGGTGERKCHFRVVHCEGR
jgi:hypothetical protein